MAADEPPMFEYKENGSGLTSEEQAHNQQWYDTLRSRDAVTASGYLAAQKEQKVQEEEVCALFICLQ